MGCICAPGNRCSISAKYVLPSSAVDRGSTVFGCGASPPTAFSLFGWLLFALLLVAHLCAFRLPLPSLRLPELPLSLGGPSSAASGADATCRAPASLADEQMRSELRALREQLLVFADAQSKLSLQVLALEAAAPAAARGGSGRSASRAA